MKKTKEKIICNIVALICIVIGGYLIGSVLGLKVGLGIVLIGWACMPMTD